MRHDGPNSNDPDAVACNSQESEHIDMMKLRMFCQVFGMILKQFVGALGTAVCRTGLEAAGAGRSYRAGETKANWGGQTGDCRSNKETLGVGQGGARETSGCGEAHDVVSEGRSIPKENVGEGKEGCFEAERPLPDLNR
jgi:hypothetical protein